jgi:hypothetical protein
MSKMTPKQYNAMPEGYPQGHWARFMKGGE